MLVYMVDHGKYLLPEESLKRRPEGKRGLYVNITNECPCACTFCLRTMKDMPEDMSLWLGGKEPTIEELKTALLAAPWDYVKEVVFCGFGEPTMRLADLIELLRFVKEQHPDLPTRVNTNGLSDLVYGRDTAADFAGGILDTVSISLNASNAERYLALTRSEFGIESFEAMLAFAEKMKAYAEHVVLTIVEKVEGAEEIAKCRALCEARGLDLRVRTYEGS